MHAYTHHMHACMHTHTHMHAHVHTHTEKKRLHKKYKYSSISSAFSIGFSFWQVVSTLTNKCENGFWWCALAPTKTESEKSSPWSEEKCGSAEASVTQPASLWICEMQMTLFFGRTLKYYQSAKYHHVFSQVSRLLLSKVEWYWCHINMGNSKCWNYFLYDNLLKFMKLTAEMITAH